MSEYVVNVGEFVGVSGKTIRFPEYIDLSQEIVRCSDCVHFDAYGNTFGWCALHDIDCSERRYCAWGARKEGGDD